MVTVVEVTGETASGADLVDDLVYWRSRSVADGEEDDGANVAAAGGGRSARQLALGIRDRSCVERICIVTTLSVFFSLFTLFSADSFPVARALLKSGGSRPRPTPLGDKRCVGVIEITKFVVTADRAAREPLAKML